MSKAPCEVCIYHRGIPGDAHKRCTHPKTATGPISRIPDLIGAISGGLTLDIALADELGVKVDMTGVKAGWCNWPHNFDPIWILDCQAGQVLKPVGIQRKRTKGWRKPPLTKMVTRETDWGNLFAVGEDVSIVVESTEGHVIEAAVQDLEHSLELFEAYAKLRMVMDPDWLTPLRGKNLACYCALDNPCHRDILLRLVVS